MCYNNQHQRTLSETFWHYLYKHCTMAVFTITLHYTTDFSWEVSTCISIKYQQCYLQYHHTTPHHNRFTALFPGPPGWAGARRELLHFMVQGKINRGRHTDHPDGCHSIRTKQCPPPPSPIFYRPDALPAAQPTVSYKLLLTIPLDSILIWSEAQLLWHNPLESQSLLHCPLPVHNSRTNLECPKLTGTGLELKRRLINANNKSYASFLPLNIRSRKFYCLMGQKMPKMLWFKIYCSFVRHCL